MSYLPSLFANEKISFSANGNGSSQSVTAAGGDVVITVANEEWDFGSAYNTGTSTFQPSVNGYYQVTANVTFTLNPSTVPMILLNGSRYKIGGELLSFNHRISCMVLMNGTSDSITFAANVATDATVDGTNQVWFSGYLVQTL